MLVNGGGRERALVSLPRGGPSRAMGTAVNDSSQTRSLAPIATRLGTQETLLRVAVGVLPRPVLPAEETDGGAGHQTRTSASIIRTAPPPFGSALPTSPRWMSTTIKLSLSPPERSHRAGKTNMPMHLGFRDQ